jgi:hypothetical protein
MQLSYEQNNHCYPSGHTSLCCLSLTQIFNQPASEARLLNKSLCLTASLGETKFATAGDIILITLCCAALVLLNCPQGLMVGLLSI